MFGLAHDKKLKINFSCQNFSVESAKLLIFFLSGWFIENVGLRNAIRKKGEELGEDGLEYLKQVDARMRNDYEKRAEKRREKKRQKREEMERKLEAEKALLPQVVPDQNHATVAV